jgi:hypothetical protein
MNAKVTSLLAASIAIACGTAAAQPLQEGGVALKDRKIGYALTHKYWSVYETEGAKTECPQGFNDGPREQFKKLYSDGKKRSIVEAQLKREGEQWHPTTEPEAFKFLEAQGNVSYGLNLDGKIGPEDFTSPQPFRKPVHAQLRRCPHRDRARRGGRSGQR